VKLALVSNPKCPLGSSLRFLSYLQPGRPRNISRSKNIPGALATSAKKLLSATGGRAPLALMDESRSDSHGNLQNGSQTLPG